MVELCELKILPESDDWPADMDDRVAQLDFGAGDSLFGSVLDQTLSTDSLDSEQLRARCVYNKEDYKLTVADSGQWASNHFTTWGRIHSVEPLDEKTASAPDVGRSGDATRSSASASNPPRPASLLANFAQLRKEGAARDAGEDAAARYVDVNENEVAMERADRWRNARPRSATLAKPRRTFADLEGTGKAPELQFLQLAHQVRRWFYLLLN